MTITLLSKLKHGLFWTGSTCGGGGGEGEAEGLFTIRLELLQSNLVH